MPIIKGHSKRAISRNIRQLYKDFRRRGHAPSKAMRMARGASYSIARRAKGKRR